MNKVRFGSLPMKCWAMLLGLLVVTAAYTDPERNARNHGGVDDARAAGV